MVQISHVGTVTQGYGRSLKILASIGSTMVPSASSMHIAANNLIITSGGSTSVHIKVSMKSTTNTMINIVALWHAITGILRTLGLTVVKCD